MTGFLIDARYSLRSLRRNPGFALGAIAVLALGVGAAASIFTVARALVFRSLPFQAPDRLVAVWKQRVETGARQGASWPDLADWRAQKHLFEGVAAYIDSTGYAPPSHPAGDAELISDIQVTPDFFPLLGVKPAMGRLFSTGEFKEEFEIATEAPVVVSDGFWRRQLGAAPDAVGRSVTIGAVRRSVIGVLPPEFRIFRNSAPEVFSPLRPFPGHSVDRRMAYLSVVARLRPGLTNSQANAGMSEYSRRAAAEHPETEAGLLYNLESLHEHWFGPMRPVMSLLLGAVALVLLIACANVAFLLLLRATRREREIAVRMALGAGRARICRQLMGEGLLLALAGGAGGFVTALWGTAWFAAFSSAADMNLPQLKLDGVVVAFTILVSLATTVVFGLLPAWRAATLDLHRHLSAAGRIASDGVVSQRFGRAVMAAEIGLSTLLLAGAAALLQGFLAITTSHPGFQPERAVTLSIAQVPLRAGFQQRDADFWSQLLSRTGALPGVEAAAICRAFPLSENVAPAKMNARFAAEGRPPQVSGGLAAEFQDVSPGYFRALGIPLLRGRVFDSPDAPKANPQAYLPVAVISQRFALELWGGEDPVGKRILSQGRPYTVVGVAGDVRQHGLWRTVPEPIVYRPLLHSDIFKWPSHFLVARTSGDPRRMASILKSLVRSLDAERPVVSVRTMEDVIFESTAWERLRLTVVSLFGFAALLLTVAGVYAVASHSVSLRRREIGIRIALGGRPDRIRMMVLRQAAAAAIAGVSGGGVAAWMLSRLLAARLHGMDAVGLPAVAAVSFLLLAATLAACYFPARKATRVDPSLALRTE